MTLKSDMQMKAMVYERYGSPDVLEFKELEKPVPKDNEVLIKVRAASVNAADTFLLRGKPLVARLESGLLKPKNKILGADIAGHVADAGSKVTQFQVGDDVFGDLSGCGFGGFAEYVCVPEHSLALKPANASFEEAASLPMASVTALQGLRKGGIEAGQQVLINGASGGVGTFAVQLAKSFGADVTAVCSTSKLELVRSLGADHVIDYTQEDFTQKGKQYDLILGVNGNRSILEYKDALAPEGTYVAIGGSMKQIFQALLLGPILSTTSPNKLLSITAKPNGQDLIRIKELVEKGKLKPVIDKRYLLQELAEAFVIWKKGMLKARLLLRSDKKLN